MSARTGFTASRVVGAFALAINILCWGLSGPIVKWGLSEVSAPAFLFFRFLIVVALTTPIMVVWKTPWRSLRSGKDFLLLILSGLFTNPLSLLLLFEGTKLTTAISASVLSALAPLFILIAGAVFLQESLGRAKLIGTIIALAGSLFIVLGTPKQLDAPAPLLGNLLIFGSNLGWTAGVLVMKKYAHAHHPLLFGYIAWVVGAIFCGILTFLTEPTLFLHPELFLDLPKASVAIVYMAIFGSLVAFPAYQMAQQVFPASDVGLSNYALPMIGVPFAAIWLKESIGSAFFISVAIMLLGILIAESHRSNARMTHSSRRPQRRR